MTKRSERWFWTRFQGKTYPQDVHARQNQETTKINQCETSSPTLHAFLSVVARIFRVRGSNLLILPQSAVRRGAPPQHLYLRCSLASTAPLLPPAGPAPQPNTPWAHRTTYMSCERRLCGISRTGGGFDISTKPYVWPTIRRLSFPILVCWKRNLNFVVHWWRSCYLPSPPPPVNTPEYKNNKLLTC